MSEWKFKACTKCGATLPIEQFDSGSFVCNDCKGK